MLAEFSFSPLEKEHVTRVVDEVLETLESAGLHYRLGPMSIAVEGTWAEMKEAIRRCHQLVALNHDEQHNFFELSPRARCPLSE
jgi:uncharacterized protein YqgV (UPF0045/DUF77 family)